MSLLAIGKVVANWLYDTLNTQSLDNQAESSCRLSVRVVRRDPHKISDSWFAKLLHVPSIRTQVDESRGSGNFFCNPSQFLDSIVGYPVFRGCVLQHITVHE